ncbi:transcriptional regulator [Paenibacillus filicis]|uniref:Transcriptional regulator n=1 Tax=Paenibacillus filicis TaxID=669464 RepID=A0ABU9DVI2_9BACL
MEENKPTAATKAKRKYNDANYERIPLDVRKGTKAEYKAAADRAGKSLNAYIQEAVEEKMKREKEQQD